MECSKEIMIHLPKEAVVQKMGNPGNFKLWQDGLISHKPIGAHSLGDGALSKLADKMGKTETEIPETVLNNNLPMNCILGYDAKGGYNIQKIYFDKQRRNQQNGFLTMNFKVAGL